MSSNQNFDAPHDLSLAVSVECVGFERKFRTTIRGVTKRNPEGTERQPAVQQLRRDEELKLVRERDNPFDKWAIAVFTLAGNQLGYLPAGDMRLANHMDMGGTVTAKVVTLRGGPGLLGWLLKSFRRPYGAVIEIGIGNLDWKYGTPILRKSGEIEALIKKAHSLESDDPRTAISIYRQAISDIVEIDSGGTAAAAWRRARYPINRLSLLLDRLGCGQEAYEEILRYERFNDVFGLTSGDATSLAKRKERLRKKFSG